MLKSVLIVISVLSVASASPQLQQSTQISHPGSLHQPEPVPIISQYSDNGVDGSFNNSYETADGIKVQNTGYLKKIVVPRYTTDDGKVIEEHEEQVLVQSGSYSYKDPEGNIISLTYIADENGFQPSGDHLPKPPGPINGNIGQQRPQQDRPIQQRPGQQLNQQRQIQLLPGQQLNQERPIQPLPGQQLNQERPIQPLPGQQLNQERPIQPLPGQQLNQERPIQPLPGQPLNQERPIQPLPGQQLNQERPIQQFPGQSLNQQRPFQQFPGQGQFGNQQFQQQQQGFN